MNLRTLVVGVALLSFSACTTAPVQNSEVSNARWAASEDNEQKPKEEEPKLDAGADDPALFAKEYKDAVKVAQEMASSPEAEKVVKRQGLEIMNVTWEDTGRSKCSSWGPNISDASIQVQVGNDDARAEDKDPKKYRRALMPIVRKSNFQDETFDVPMNQIKLVVGNQKKGAKLETVSLTDYLHHIDQYLTGGGKDKAGKKQVQSLLATRDSHVLVSAQMAYLPIAKGGKAIFNPTIFNYQSCKKNPAILAIVATRAGTSATVVDNNRDKTMNSSDATYGQSLFINQDGTRYDLRGDRASEAPNAGAAPVEGAGAAVPGAAQGKGNMVMMIQVPLKQKEKCRGRFGGGLEAAFPQGAARSMMPKRAENEDANISAGNAQGPFTEIDDGVTIERDPEFPVRVTVQFYRATETGEATDAEVLAFRKQLDEIKGKADYVGSLVTSENVGRPTEHNVQCKYFRPWLRELPADVSQNMRRLNFGGEAEAKAAFAKIYGPHWWPYYVCRTKADFERASRHVVDYQDWKAGTMKCN